MFFAFIALFFVVLPLAEIAVGFQVAQWIGVGDTLGLILLFSIVGAWVAWHMGFSVLRKTRYQLAQGNVPTDDLIDAALVFGAGVLLFVPGFITDAFGLLLLFPPTRHVARSLLKRRFRTRITRYGYTYGTSTGFGNQFGGPSDNVIDV